MPLLLENNVAQRNRFTVEEKHRMKQLLEDFTERKICTREGELLNYMKLCMK